MTTPTMEQRRADFEAMLERVDLARATIPPSDVALAETGGPLAVLARDVAELCAAWAGSAARARTHRPGDQTAARARIVAARCLRAITELEGVQGIPLADLFAAMVDDAEDCLGAHSDEWLDLGVDPRLRVQSLISALGEVAEWWPVTSERPTLPDLTPGEWQFASLFRLFFEAVCAAVAAERGLWQEDAA